MPFRKRIGSACSSNLSTKSSSLASLLLCSKSASIDEDDVISKSKLSTQRALSSIGSCESLNHSSASLSTLNRLQSPTTVHFKPMTSTQKSLSTSGLLDPRRSPSPQKKSPHRLGKPPNILVLCESDKKRAEIVSILKTILSNDR